MKKESISKKILLSVIVPIFNVDKYLEQCIISLCAVRNKELEIILVDDGSIDGSGNICDRYQEKDSRIRVIHKENGGLVTARKAGFSIARGDYITSVDGDDWVDSDRYQRSIELIDLYSPDVITMEGYIREYENGDKKVFGNKDIVESFYSKNRLGELYELIFDSEKPFKRICMSHTNIIVKRSISLRVINEVSDGLFISEDLVYGLGCLCSASTIVTLPNTGYHYRMRSDSMSRIMGGIEEDAVNLLCQNTIKIVGNKIRHNIIREKVIRALFYELMFLDYRSCLRSCPNYLIPFSDVKKGSKIVICGAGNFGRAIVKAIDETKARYHIIAVVDDNTDMPPVGKFIVEGVERVISMNYDHVIIANYYLEQAEKKKEMLRSFGVSGERISCMNYMTMVEKNLPPKIKNMLNEGEKV